jgi:hypothetical protein
MAGILRVIRVLTTLLSVIQQKVENASFRGGVSQIIRRITNNTIPATSSPTGGHLNGISNAIDASGRGAAGIILMHE